MDEFFKVITSTYTYRATLALIIPLWNDPVGRIFVLTIFSYFTAYSIYGGYLTRFTAGFGGLSFSRIGFQVIDLITLLPTAIFTIIDIGTKAFRSILIWLAKAAFYLASAFIIGFGIGFIILQLGIVLPAFITLIGPIIYIIGLYAALTLSLVTNKYRGLLKATWLLQVLGLVVTTIGIPNASQLQPIRIPVVEIFLLNVVYPIVYEVIILFTILIFSLLPSIFGRQMADFAMQQDVLSKVTSLNLKQPLSSLDVFKQNISKETNKIIPMQQTWLTKSSIPINIEPDVYVYNFDQDKPLYLIASFSELTAFYIAQKEGQIVGGKLIVIMRDLIYAVELDSPKN